MARFGCLSFWQSHSGRWMEGQSYFFFLIETPGTFTRKNWMLMISLEAYNYYHSGHVQTVYYHSIKSNLCILKGKVNPSQRSPSLAHEAGVVLKKKGAVVSGHCRCLAEYLHVSNFITSCSSDPQFSFPLFLFCFKFPCFHSCVPWPGLFVDMTRSHYPRY